ncbi:MAG: hypothetical protein AAFX95_10345 [Cyanobacteria bacterium J06639_16]
MIEIFLALVAAFRKDWGAWVCVPLLVSIGSVVGLMTGPEGYRIVCLGGYFGALVMLGLMSVCHRRGVLGS